MDEEKKFIITESQISEINHYLTNYSYLAIRSSLKQLPLLEENSKKNVNEKIFSDKEIEEIEIALCRKLDEDVYLPVKEELKGIRRTYSLGMRKETFKGTIHDLLSKLNSKKGGQNADFQKGTEGNELPPVE